MTLGIIFLIIALVTPTATRAYCRSYETVSVTIGPYTTATVYKWTGELSHNTVNVLDPQTMPWVTLLLFGWIISHSPTLFAREFNPKPATPPPRFA
ncbi:MAG: hypothetical protein KDE56_10655 [Anaerolineales bacterium]|nr:hypothetical protein [Anaerolineales bacterium]